jgi:hypothetical protein
VLLLNRDENNSNDIALNWIDVGIVGNKVVRDVFAGKELGKLNHSVTQTVAPHASVFLTIKNQ